ncbi:hypothetical protein JXB02_01385 [Candidatus Woesearchaeota archaeon]|nr:hypothetical protein [Candidatus Woesearchaeota archaeon]
MRKAILMMIIGLLFCGIALAQGQGGQGTGGQADDTGQPEDAGQPDDTGQQEPMLISAGGEGQGQAGAEAGEGQTVKAQDMEQIREMLQEKRQEMAQETVGEGAKIQAAHQNQNEVRIAVHAMLALGEHMGGIGPQVSAIAKEFNNSVQATIRAEERIETRSAFARLFAGGDAEAAGELERQVGQNRERIQELERLRDSCTDCDPAVKSMFQEQLQAMEQEQDRLGELAGKEKGSKGLFGWIWK